MRRIAFDDFEIDLDLFTLNKCGVAVAIGQRPLDLLLCLIENRDRVVDQSFLRRAVWNSAALSPAAIPTCILELRRALGDNASKPRYVESVRGRGYRFICGITRASPSAFEARHATDQLIFSGRDAEVNSLKQCVKASITEARGFTVLINGEAGMGKTRLLEEFLAGTTNTVDVLLSRASNIEGAPPLWPWTQLLRNALKGIGRQNKKLIAHAQALSTVFPEIRGSVSPSLTTDRPVDQFTIFAHWTRTIRSMIGFRPLLLAFEDIHRADADSLSLLYQLSQELSDDPVVLIATHRPETTSEYNSKLLARLSGARNVIRISLRPLSTSDVRSMLDPFINDREVVSEALRSRTAGIPFYLTQIIRMVAHDHQHHSTESLVSALPSNADELVSRQLSDLPAHTREILAVASVEGEQFSIKALSAILSIPPADVIAQLEPAIRACFIHTTGPDCTFSHALLRDAIYETFDSCRRRTIHLLLARRLAEGTDAQARSSQISDHLNNALPLAPLGEALHFALLAGREAARRFAFARAEVLFERARKISMDDPECTMSVRCEIMRELARTTFYTGNQNRARELLIKAASIARQISSPTILAACALDLSPDFLSIEVGSYDATLIQLLEEAIGVVERDDVALRAQLYSRLAQANQWSPRTNCDEALATTALRLARESEDDEALISALSARAESLHGPNRVLDRLEHVVELGNLALGRNRVTTLLVAQTRLMACLLELGEIKTLEVENDRYRVIATELGVPQYLWYPGATDTMIAMLQGDVEKAEALATEYRRLAGPTPDQNFAQTYACQYVVREIERDRSKQVLSLARRFSEQHKAVYSWSAAVAWLQWDAGRAREARASLQQFAERDIDAMAREAGGGIGIAVLAELAARLEDYRRAEYLYRFIEPITDRHVSAGYGIAYFGSFARYAGLLAGILGESRIAVSHFELAMERELSIGSLTWHCYTQLDFATLCDQNRTWPLDRRNFILNLESRIDELDSPRIRRRHLETLGRNPS